MSTGDDRLGMMSELPSAIEPRIVIPEDTPAMGEPEVEPLEIDFSAERNTFAAILAVLLAVTAIVGFFNHRMLERGRGLSSPFSIELRSALREPASYRVDVDWTSTPVDAVGQLPVVVVGGEPIGRVGAGGVLELEVPEASRPMKPVEMGLRVGEAVVPGSYVGQIRFVPAVGPGATRASEFQFPLSITVPGPWEEWFLLRDWLLLASGVLFATWLCALFLWPAPRGRLRFLYHGQGVGWRDDEVPLRQGVLGFLFPWRRCIVDVSALVRRRSWGRELMADLPAVNLQFLRFGLTDVYPCVLNTTGHREVRLVRSEEDVRGVADLDEARAFRLMPLFQSRRDRWFVLRSRDGTQRGRVAFQHVR